MAASEEIRAEPPPPAVPLEHRSKVRTGFGLSCAGFALALAAGLGVNVAPLFTASPGVEWLETHQEHMKLAFTVLSLIVEIVLVGGWVTLYMVPHLQRWRQTGAWLLGLAGCELVLLTVQLFSADTALVAVADALGFALRWVELWLIAVLAAEAAESAGRSDITYQTEVSGRLILWGGFIWLASEIWRFDPKQWPAAETDTLGIGQLLGVATVVMLLFVLFRTAMFCGGLFAAYSPTSDPSRPETPA